MTSSQEAPNPASCSCHCFSNVESFIDLNMPDRSVVEGCSNVPHSEKGIALHKIPFFGDDQNKAISGQNFYSWDVQSGVWLLCQPSALVTSVTKILKENFLSVLRNGKELLSRMKSVFLYWCSNQLSWSFVSSNDPMKNGYEVIYEMFDILNCGFEIK